MGVLSEIVDYRRNNLQVGDRVQVDILKGGYWVNSVKGRVVKLTEKRVTVESHAFPGGKTKRSFCYSNVRKV